MEGDCGFGEEYDTWCLGDDDDSDSGDGSGSDDNAGEGDGDKPGNIDKDVSNDLPTFTCEVRSWMTGCPDVDITRCFYLREGGGPQNGWRETDCSWEYGFSTERFRFEFDDHGWLAFWGLGVDGVGALADGASIVGLYFGPPGLLVSSGFQEAATYIEALWISYMTVRGKDVDLDYYLLTKTIDAESGLPILGLGSSLEGISTNADIIGEYWVPHQTWFETWDGSIPPYP
jgi:hypothetical protein